MTELSPAAQAVLQAATRQACLAEWGTINDPPCHPDDEGWNGCHLCVKRDLIAAALRAAADQVVPEEELPVNARGTKHWHKVNQRAETRSKLLAIAAELRT